MPSKKKAAAPKKPMEPTPLDLLKLEIATELGLADKVATAGWAELTAVETGRVGGILNRKLKERGVTIGPKGSLIPMS
jgi:hypothetical protein